MSFHDMGDSGDLLGTTATFHPASPVAAVPAVTRLALTSHAVPATAQTCCHGLRGQLRGCLIITYSPCGTVCLEFILYVFFPLGV